jgi:cell division protein FtsB
VALYYHFNGIIEKEAAMPFVLDQKKTKDQQVEDVRAEFNKVRELMKARDANSEACKAVVGYVKSESDVLRKEYLQQFPGGSIITDGDRAKLRAFYLVVDQLNKDLLVTYKELETLNVSRKISEFTETAMIAHIRYGEEIADNAINNYLEEVQLAALRVKTIDEFSKEARFKFSEFRKKIAVKTYDPLVVPDYKPIQAPDAMTTVLDALARQAKEIEKLKNEVVVLRSQLKDQKAPQPAPTSMIVKSQQSSFFP